jgi:hypothetical protein
MINFLLELLVMISIVVIFKFINLLHRTYYMNGEVKDDGSIVFNKNIIYEVLSVLIHIFLIGTIFYFSIFNNKVYLFIVFVPFIFASVKGVFHILKNIKTQIIISHQIMTITNPNGEKFEIVPIQIEFDEVEEDEVWYRRRKRKYRIMEIEHGDSNILFFNFNENNFADYSIHIQKHCKKMYGQKIKVDECFKENFGLKEYGLLFSILTFIWIIYLTFKHLY